VAAPDVPPPPPWRIGRGWPEQALQDRLRDLADRPASRAAGQPDVAGPGAPSPEWTAQQFRASLGQEPPGPPLTDGTFARVRRAIQGYRFADPRITRGTFDPARPLLGREILVEARTLPLRLLVGLRVGAVTDRADDAESRFGIRLDTLAGHVLDGAEWIEVIKDHRTGEVWLRIAVRWRPARLPWWMGLGFRLLGRTVQARWRRQAVRRLRALGA
jgi:uncharacterized protein (UPF0548 family)